MEGVLSALLAGLMEYFMMIRLQRIFHSFSFGVLFVHPYRPYRGMHDAEFIFFDEDSLRELWEHLQDIGSTIQTKNMQWPVGME